MFFIDNAAASDSDSECEIPQFCINAFSKFKYPEHENNTTELSTASTLNDDNAQISSRAKCVLPNSFEAQNESMKTALDENLKKSIVCQPEFEKLDKAPPIIGKMKRKKLAAKERAKTTGDKWYNMPAPELTDEKKNDLLVLQMRKALDPKHFYKRSAHSANPKYFQMGTYVESPVDFYSSRIPKKQRKQTLVDELMADAEFRNYQKKKVTEIQMSRPRKYIAKKVPTHKMRVKARAAAASQRNHKGKRK